MEDPSSMMTWKGVERLLQDLTASFTPPFPKRIVAVTRGGMAIGQMLGYLLDVRRIDIINCMSYGDDRQQSPLYVIRAPGGEYNDNSTVFVDDITDTGQTMALIGQVYPQAFRYCLVAKPAGKAFVHFYSVAVAQDCWVDFPWELKRGARIPLSVEVPTSPQ